MMRKVERKRKREALEATQEGKVLTDQTDKENRPDRNPIRLLSSSKHDAKNASMSLTDKKATSLPKSQPNKINQHKQHLTPLA